MPLYLHELRRGGRSLILWIGGTGLFILLTVPKFAVYMHNPQLARILDSMPQGLLKALHMNAFSLLTVEGYVGLMHPYLALFAAIVGVTWGGGPIAGEERDRTADFTLTLPLPRSRVLTGKLLAAVTRLAAYGLAVWGMNFLAVRYLGPTPQAERFLALSMAGIFLIGLIFLALGFFTACLASPKRTGGLPLALVFAFYFLSLLPNVSDRLDFLKYLTPFQYFDALDIAARDGLAPRFLALTAAWVILLVAAGYAVYNRRDITT